MHKSHQKSSELRIIGGKFRGRKILFIPDEQLRPTGNRIRETLFNWLAPSIVGSNCLDLFAGSGVLSFEALSREAKHVTLLENNKSSVQQLIANRERLKICQDQMQIIHADCIKALTHLSNFYQIIFIDPPYAQDQLLHKVLNILPTLNNLSSNSKIYFESDKNLSQHQSLENYHILKSEKAGNVYYYLLSIKDLSLKSHYTNF